MHTVSRRFSVPSVELRGSTCFYWLRSYIGPVKVLSFMLFFLPRAKRILHIQNNIIPQSTNIDTLIFGNNPTHSSFTKVAIRLLLRHHHSIWNLVGYLDCHFERLIIMVKLSKQDITEHIRLFVDSVRNQTDGFNPDKPWFGHQQGKHQHA